MNHSDRQNAYTLDLADCCTWLGQQPRGSIDLIVTDPAYASLEKHRVTTSGKQRGTTTRLSQSNASSNDWFDIFPDKRYGELFAHAHNALAKDAHMYVMCAADHDQQHVMIEAAELVGFKFWKAIVWDKMRIGMGYHWRAQHEVILFFEKGKRKLNHLGWPDVIRHPSLRNNHGVYANQALDRAMDAYAEHVEFMYGNRDAMRAALDAAWETLKEVPTMIAEQSIRSGNSYPTEKPVPLWGRLIANSASPGQVVADPFMGSGSSGEAALLYGCRYRGCDTNPTSIEVAGKRLNRVWYPEAHARSF